MTIMSHEFKGEEKKQFDSVVAYLNERIAAKFPGVKLELQDVVDGRCPAPILMSSFNFVALR